MIFSDKFKRASFFRYSVLDLSDDIRTIMLKEEKNLRQTCSEGLQDYYIQQSNSKTS
jgi:hypothetical protein